MHCFAHRETPALAICKHCGRGVCGDCAVESTFGVSCRGACEREVLEGRALSHWMFVEQKRAIARRRSETIALLVMGIIFWGLAAWMAAVSAGLAAGIPFVFGAVLVFSAIYRMDEADRERRGK